MAEKNSDMVKRIEACLAKNPKLKDCMPKICKKVAQLQKKQAQLKFKQSVVKRVKKANLTEGQRELLINKVKWLMEKRAQGQFFDNLYAGGRETYLDGQGRQIRDEYGPGVANHFNSVVNNATRQGQSPVQAADAWRRDFEGRVQNYAGQPAAQPAARAPQPRTGIMSYEEFQNRPIEVPKAIQSAANRAGTEFGHDLTDEYRAAQQLIRQGTPARQALQLAREQIPGHTSLYRAQQRQEAKNQAEYNTYLSGRQKELARLRAQDRSFKATAPKELQQLYSNFLKQQYAAGKDVYSANAAWEKARPQLESQMALRNYRNHLAQQHGQTMANDFTNFIERSVAQGQKPLQAVQAWRSGVEARRLAEHKEYGQLAQEATEYEMRDQFDKIMQDAVTGARHRAQFDGVPLAQAMAEARADAMETWDKEIKRKLGHGRGGAATVTKPHVPHESFRVWPRMQPIDRISELPRRAWDRIVQSVTRTPRAIDEGLGEAWRGVGEPSFYNPAIERLSRDPIGDQMDWAY